MLHATNPTVMSSNPASIASTLIPPQTGQTAADGSQSTIDESSMRGASAICEWLEANQPLSKASRAVPSARNQQPIRTSPANSGSAQFNVSQVESYYSPKSTVRTFNSVFPLGRIFNKWRNGIPLFVKAKTSFVKPNRHTSPALSLAVENLLSAGIISPSRRCSFNSNIFLVTKVGGKCRPIFNYAHLSDLFTIPRMVLPSVFQLVKNKPWPEDLYFLKYDFRHAFFNIPLHKRSRFVTTFYYNKKFYVVNFLPFGASISPYVMQKFLNAICKYIREHFTPYTWGHLDDLIIAHRDPEFLLTIANHMSYLFKLINWVVNPEKSVLVPVRQIIFLGAIWGKTGITRLPEVTESLKIIWSLIRSIRLSPKGLQRVRGYLNYYLNFAGNFFAVVNRILKLKNKGAYDRIVSYLISKKHINFVNPKPKREVISIHTDATPTQIAAVVTNDQKLFFINRSLDNILMNELKAALAGISLFIRNFSFTSHFLNLFTDNLAVLYFLRKGRCKWRSNIFTLFKFLYFVNNHVSALNVKFHYIPSAFNKADKLSRLNSIFYFIFIL